MARIIDAPDNTTDEQVSTNNEQVQNTAAPDDELPEKYRGKSVKDIVRMHQEAEKLAGRHAQELGELRSITDEYIKTSLKASPTQTKESDDETDFFVDPRTAVKKVIENDPEIKKLRATTQQLEAQANLRALEQKHSDYKDLISDPAFGEWVQKSKYRMQLFRQADANWDFESADELFSTWKEIHGAKNTSREDTAKERKEAVRKAATPSGGTAPVAGDSRKVYRRADLIRLQQTDPARYAALQPEIMKAYQEGRVR